MGLVDVLNEELARLKRVLQNTDGQEIQASCNNINHSLWRVRDTQASPSLRFEIYVDPTIREIPEDEEVYRPDAYFWQRVMPNQGRRVPASFSVYQPLLQQGNSLYYGVEFVYGGPHQVECRIYIHGASHAPQQDDDIIFEESEQPCLIVFPHEILSFMQNGQRNVTSFMLR